MSNHIDKIISEAVYADSERLVRALDPLFRAVAEAAYEAGDAKGYRKAVSSVCEEQRVRREFARELLDELKDQGDDDGFAKINLEWLRREAGA